MNRRDKTYLVGSTAFLPVLHFMLWTWLYSPIRTVTPIPVPPDIDAAVVEMMEMERALIEDFPPDEDAEVIVTEADGKSYLWTGEDWAPYPASLDGESN